MSAAQFINRQEKWNAIAEGLAAAAELAIDTESNSMHAYRGRICLIQIASAAGSYLLDPLAVEDLSRLGDILANPAITKVMHGADYDLRSFYRECGFAVAGLFDTEICARFCGMVSPNLAAVLRTFLEVDIPKSRRLQRSDWSVRPLTAEAVAYAAADVQHLIPLARKFRRLLRDSGRLDWVAEEFTRLEQAGRVAPEPAEPSFFRVKGSERLEPRQLAILKELFEIREAEAQRLNRPSYQVLNNEALLYLAQQPLVPLEEVPGLSPHLVRRMGARLKAAIQKGMREPGIQRPLRPRRTPPGKDAQQRAQRLKQWRSGKGVSLGLDPAHIWPAASLERLALNPAEWEWESDPDGAPEVRNWQRQEFAPELKQALAAAAEFPAN